MVQWAGDQSFSSVAEFDMGLPNQRNSTSALQGGRFPCNHGIESHLPLGIYFTRGITFASS